MSESERQPLEDVTVGIYIAPRGTEEPEFIVPKRALEEAGATVDVLSSEPGEAETRNNDLDPGETFEVDKTFDDVSPDDYDGLIVPGGTVGADRLRLDDEAVTMVREHVTADRPIGVICHGPWLLVEADVVENLTVTSWPSLETDIRNAGGEWVDEEVVTDRRVVTSRKPDDLDVFCERIVEAFGTVTG